MKAYNFARFLLRQRVLGFDVPTTPHFDSVGSTEWFADELAQSSRYLEFGTGGSTYLAARLGVQFVAVDSDRYFLRDVERKIRRDGYFRPGQVFKHAEIGLTGAWARPVGPISAGRRERFRRYSDVPEQYTSDLPPDLVLVDGRFRVACALKALDFLSSSPFDWKVVVDDFVGRPHYAVIAKFADIRMVGRMAVLSQLKPAVDISELRAEISRWEVVPD